jgi:P-type Mg2+ transporter
METVTFDAFWSIEPEKVLEELQTSKDGLSSPEAAARLKKFGPNTLKVTRRRSTLSLLVAQFKSPIILILIIAAVISAFVQDLPDAIIILAIIFISGMLGFWQERGAAQAVDKLLALVRVTATVMRDGKRVNIGTEEVVPGDILVMDAGDVIPADALLLEENDLYVDEATLTGETFPVEKEIETPPPADSPISKRTNAVFLGTHVVSGTATAVAVGTGAATELGRISEHLKGKREETEFERGIRHFGYLLMEVTLILVIAIFAINVTFHKAVLESFLFSLALAVGLTPQLLPAIISINLSKGAKKMAEEKVIVKRLASIENFGSMNVFCSDKTGTLTKGIVEVDQGLDIEGGRKDEVIEYAFINASFESGFTNPIDEAIRKQEDADLSRFKKLDEIPYDFGRKRLSILVSEKSEDNLLITKGAVLSVLEVCTTAEKPDGSVTPLDAVRSDVQGCYEDLSSKGLRTLGVAIKRAGSTAVVKAADETDMTFVGMLSLLDPPKEDAAETIEELASLGVRLKVITGDNRLVAAHVGGMVGIEHPEVVTGSQIAGMRGEALTRQVEKVDIFAEVEPNQKELIINALRDSGNVVGYMGDGVNDAPALHAADVSLSVDTAVDVAKGTADFVLLEKDLGVLAKGVREGRVTFANTMKYVFMATSANFGNMFSMAGASIFLPYLPLLPGQILLMNLLTDMPELTIATDRVDPEMVDHPERWNIQFIRRFMLVFGLLSSVFDYATFGVLLLLLNANMLQFRTGWFIESVISASMIVLVIRTRRFFLKSRPSKYLFWMTIAVAAIVIALPYTPLGGLFGFKPIPPYFYPLLLAIMILYVSSAEIAKRLFYRWTKY